MSVSVVEQIAFESLIQACVMATIVFNSVMIAVISVMLVSQFDAYMTVLIQHLFNVDVWASAIILVLLKLIYLSCTWTATRHN